MNSIFVQIVSYRDKELVPTIRDLLYKSSGNNHINIGIVWQKDHTESLEEFASHPNIRIMSYSYLESKGLGWARNLVQTLYRGEDYVMQLDSHHRFGANWDEILIDMISGLRSDSNKPIITTHAAEYDPDLKVALKPVVTKIVPVDFKQSGTLWRVATHVHHSQMHRPIRGLFVSGHYYFTLGTFIEDYKYDPELYFAGDEISLSIRSYTLGYDIYHPNRCVVYHYYGREGHNKHWVDHSEQTKNRGDINNTAIEIDTHSKKRIRQLLGQEDYGIDMGIYGLGKQRTLDDFIKYSGMDIKNKVVHNRSVLGGEPPIYDNVSNSEWLAGFMKNCRVMITDWPRYKYMVQKQRYTHIEVDFMTLQRTINHTHHMSINEVIETKNNRYIRNFQHTNLPHRVIFRGMHNNSVVDTWEKDLYPNIQWF